MLGIIRVGKRMKIVEHFEADSTLSWELLLVGSVLGQGWESERGIGTGRE